MDGTDGSQTFIDSSVQAHSINAKGNAQIDTAQSKFGGASGLFDGSGDYLSLADSADWAFGTGDFTVDFWVRWNSLPANGGAQTLWQQASTAANVQWLYLYNDAGTYRYYLSVKSANVAVINWNVASPGISTNTWYHIALVRSGSSWYLFQAGTQCGATQTDADAIPDIAGGAAIGADVRGAGGYYINGWLDEFRVSKGVARWTSNFTPPAAPY
jgi:hypothetical protein